MVEQMSLKEIVDYWCSLSTGESLRRTVDQWCSSTGKDLRKAVQRWTGKGAR